MRENPCPFCLDEVRELQGNNYEQIYKDERVVILYDTTRTDKTYFLVYPRTHIESLNLIKEWRELNDCLSAINRAMWLGELKDSFLFISKATIEDSHAHFHVQAQERIEKDLMRERLTPYFYKESEYYTEVV